MATLCFEELQLSTKAFEEEVRRRLMNSSELVTLPDPQLLCVRRCERGEPEAEWMRPKGVRRRRGQGPREAPGLERPREPEHGGPAALAPGATLHRTPHSALHVLS